MVDRAMSPVVGKAMEATLVVLYVGLVTATLYGGAIPEYRTAAGEEVAERTVSSAATDIENAIPPEAVRAEINLVVALPTTIAGDRYRIYAEGDRLVLDHPNPEVSTGTPLVLPGRVLAVSGNWESGESARIHVTTVDGGLEVRLE